MSASIDIGRLNETYSKMEQREWRCRRFEGETMVSPHLTVNEWQWCCDVQNAWPAISEELKALREYRDSMNALIGAVDAVYLRGENERLRQQLAEQAKGNDDTPITREWLLTNGGTPSAYDEDIFFEGFLVTTRWGNWCIILNRDAFEVMTRGAVVRLTSALKDELSPIPEGVYFSQEHDTFYSCETRREMGTAFHERWHYRNHEFPLTPTAKTIQ